MIYATNEGNVYWIDSDQFPSNNPNKNLLLSGVAGMIKAVLSPSGDLLAVGGADEYNVYLISLSTKSIVHTYGLAGNNTRAITWDDSSSKIYVATGT